MVGNQARRPVGANGQGKGRRRGSQSRSAGARRRLSRLVVRACARHARDRGGTRRRLGPAAPPGRIEVAGTSRPHPRRVTTEMQPGGGRGDQGREEGAEDPTPPRCGGRPRIARGRHRVTGPCRLTDLPNLAWHGRSLLPLPGTGARRPPNRQRGRRTGERDRYPGHSTTRGRHNRRVRQAMRAGWPEGRPRTAGGVGAGRQWIRWGRSRRVRRPGALRPYHMRACAW